MMQRQMAMPKGSKDADSEKTDDASTDESSDTDEETKILNQRMTHPQITQTKAKRQMVTVMVRELQLEKHHLC